MIHWNTVYQTEYCCFSMNYLPHSNNSKNNSIIVSKQIFIYYYFVNLYILIVICTINVIILKMNDLQYVRLQNVPPSSSSAMALLVLMV